MIQKDLTPDDAYNNVIYDRIHCFQSETSVIK